MKENEEHENAINIANKWKNWGEEKDEQLQEANARIQRLLMIHDDLHRQLDAARARPVAAGAAAILPPLPPLVSPVGPSAPKKKGLKKRKMGRPRTSCGKCAKKKQRCEHTVLAIGSSSSESEDFSCFDFL